MTNWIYGRKKCKRGRKKMELGKKKKELVMVLNGCMIIRVIMV